MQKLYTSKKRDFSLIVISICFIIGLIIVGYINIMDRYYDENMDRLKQSFTEAQEKELQNDVDKLITVLETEYDYIIDGYQRMLGVVEATLQYQMKENYLNKNQINQDFIVMSKIYKALEIRVYDQVNKRLILTAKNGDILASNEETGDVYSDFKFYREFTTSGGQYLILLGVTETYLADLYQSKMQKHFDNYSSNSGYALVDLNKYRNENNLADLIKDKKLYNNYLSLINGNYQDDGGYRFLDDMLLSLKQNGNYTGYVQDNHNPYMVYAKLYKNHNLILLKSKCLKNLNEKMIVEMEKFENNLILQINIAIIITILMFLFAMLSSLIIFKHLKSRIIESERERNHIIKEHNKVLSRKNDQLNQLAHDIRNHLMCINGFINQKDIELARSYIESVYEDCNQLSSIVITTNRLIDIILNDKISEMNKIGINFEIGIEPISLDFIDFKDMTIILTNILDNAIESCIKSEQKDIQFTISSFNESYLLIKIVNSCNQAPIMHKRNLMSTKIQKDSHGYGVKNIKRAVSKYNGEIYFDYDERVREFTFMVIFEIPNQVRD